MANPVLQGAISGRHYWELAPANTKGTYSTYRILENEVTSKTPRRSFDVEIWSFAATVTGAALLSEMVRAALLGSGMYFKGGESGYVDDNTREGYVKLIFKFNL